MGSGSKIRPQLLLERERVWRRSGEGGYADDHSRLHEKEGKTCKQCCNAFVKVNPRREYYFENCFCKYPIMRKVAVLQAGTWLSSSATFSPCYTIRSLASAPRAHVCFSAGKVGRTV